MNYTDYCFSHYHAVCNTKGCNENIDDITKYRTCPKCREYERERKAIERNSPHYKAKELIKRIEATALNKHACSDLKISDIIRLIGAYKNEI